jgi:hypothetical protein
VNGWTVANSKYRETVVRNENLDLLLVTETHWTENRVIELDGYTCYNNNRSRLHRQAKKGSGGVAIYVKNSISVNHSVKVIDKEMEGIIGIELVEKGSGFQSVFFCCYLAPENSVWGRDSDSFFVHLTTQMYLYEDADIIMIGGDFNARIGNSPDYIVDVDDVTPRHNIDEIKAGHGEALLDFLKESRMLVLNGRLNNESNDFTSTSVRGKAVVDYFMTKHDNINLCSNFKVKTMSDVTTEYNLLFDINDVCKPPDHSLLTVNCQVTYYTRGNGEKNIKQKGDAYKVYNYQNIPENMFTSNEWSEDILQQIESLLQLRVSQEKIDNIYNHFCNSVIIEMDNYLNYRMVTSNNIKKRLKPNKPFWDEELTESWKNVAKCERGYLKSKRRDRDFKQLRHTFITARNKFDKMLKSKARQYNYSKIATIEHSAHHDHKEFWDNIKRLGPHKSTAIPLQVKINDEAISDLNQVKQKWREDFHTLLNTQQNNHEFDEEFLQTVINEKEYLENSYIENNNDDLNKDITTDELNKVINKLKLKKACGIDAIPNEILKHKNIHPYLILFFQACLESGITPSVWKQALIKPIPKSSSKDPLVPLNYRGISLISCISKTYSSIINNRIMQFCDDHNLLVDEQNGFRKDRSCDDHIFSLTSIVENRLNEDKNTFCAFIDLEKAFDWLNRDLLLYSLLKLDIKGRIYKSVKHLLQSTQACINLTRSVQTDWFDITAGVRQGDPLSPTLFSIYINSLALRLKESCPTLSFGEHTLNSLLYADDMVVITESEQDLQTCLNTIERWCNQWRVRVNEEKSKIIHFRKKRNLETEYEFRINNVNLEKVGEYKYLGITLDFSLSFEQCFKGLSDSGGRALGAIINKFSLLKNVGYKTFTTLYNTGVMSVLLYGSCVWGSRNTSKLDCIQNRAMRYFLGVHRYTPIASMLGDMGWFPLYIYQFLAVARYWNRLINMNCTRLTKAIFEEDYRRNSRNWSARLSDILIEHGCYEYFERKEQIVLPDFQRLLKESYIMKWRNIVQSKPKLRTYNQIKDSFETEEYVKYINNRSERSILAQFRCGILPLELETGRYRNIDVNNRFCFHCTNLVEDEIHFALVCPLYNAERQLLIDEIMLTYNIFGNLDQLNKLKVLLNEFWKQTSKFLYKSWNIRRNLIWQK